MKRWTTHLASMPVHRFFDRTFLNSLSWEQWLEQIEFIKENLSDEVIETSMQAWPDTIQDQIAADVVKVIKARRDDMINYAHEHYLFLSKEVEVVGSDKHEHFLVQRINDEATRVIVRKRKKDGELEQVLYDRTFNSQETKEIRLFGLGGEDIFEIEGEVTTGIVVRVIGGRGEDRIEDRSKVRGWKDHTVVYDMKNDTELIASSETDNELSNNRAVNRYDRKSFEYNNMVPLVSAQFNRDDGVFLGGGFIYTKEGWRKDPFAQRHKLRANVALATGAANIYYDGTFTDLIHKWDLNADVSVQRPYGVANFFGYGNESTFDAKGNGAASDFGNPIDLLPSEF